MRDPPLIFILCSVFISWVYLICGWTNRGCRLCFAVSISLTKLFCILLWMLIAGFSDLCSLVEVFEQDTSRLVQYICFWYITPSSLFCALLSTLSLMMRVSMEALTMLDYEQLFALPHLPISGIMLLTSTPWYSSWGFTGTTRRRPNTKIKNFIPKSTSMASRTCSLLGVSWSVGIFSVVYPSRLTYSPSSMLKDCWYSCLTVCDQKIREGLKRIRGLVVCLRYSFRSSLVRKESLPQPAIQTHIKSGVLSTGDAVQHGSRIYKQRPRR